MQLHHPVDASLPSSPTDRSSRRLLVGILCGMVAFALIWPLLRPDSVLTRVYRHAAQRVVMGQPYYRSDDGPAFTYPPAAVVLYLPLAWLPDYPARAAWCLVNCVCLGAAAWLLFRLCAPVVRDTPRRRRQLTWIFLLSGLLSLRFAISPIEYQAHDPILALLVVGAVAAWASHHFVRAGLLAGLGVAMKATPLLFLPVFLWQRRVLAATTLVAAAVLATFLPDMILPSNNGTLSVMTWYQMFVAKVGATGAAEAEGAWQAFNIMNQSISGSVHRLFTPTPPDVVERFGIACPHWPLPGAAVHGLTLALKLAVLAWIFVCTRRRYTDDASRNERRFRVAAQGAMIAAAILLLSPMTSRYHYCLLPPAIVVLATDFVARRPTWIVGTIMAGLGFLSIGADILGETLQYVGNFYGLQTWCALGCVWACGWVIVDRHREEVAVQQAAQNTTSNAERSTIPFPTAWAERPPRRLSA